MIRRLAVACAVAGLALGVAQAEDMMMGDHPPMMPHPEVVLGPPEGFMPPADMPPPPMTGMPEEDMRMVADHFFKFMDADHSGSLDMGEFMAWVRRAHLPPPGMMPPPEGMMMPPGTMPPGEMPPGEMPPGEMPPGEMPPGEMPPGEMPPGGMPPMEMGGILRAGEGDLAGLNIAPECSDDLRENELLPQAENVPCGDRQGNLLFRTVCNMPGYDRAAISLPDGRAAACFGLEALRGEIGFRIVREDDGSVVYDTMMGKDPYRMLKLDGPAVYQIQSTGGSPDGAVTLKFVDVPR